MRVLALAAFVLLWCSAHAIRTHGKTDDLVYMSLLSEEERTVVRQAMEADKAECGEVCVQTTTLVNPCCQKRCAAGSSSASPCTQYVTPGVMPRQQGSGGERTIVQPVIVQQPVVGIIMRPNDSATAPPPTTASPIIVQDNKREEDEKRLAADRIRVKSEQSRKQKRAEEMEKLVLQTEKEDRQKEEARTKEDSVKQEKKQLLKDQLAQTELAAKAQEKEKVKEAAFKKTQEELTKQLEKAKRDGAKAAEIAKEQQRLADLNKAEQEQKWREQKAQEQADKADAKTREASAKGEFATKQKAEAEGKRQDENDRKRSVEEVQKQQSELKGKSKKEEDEKQVKEQDSKSKEQKRQAWLQEQAEKKTAELVSKGEKESQAKKDAEQDVKKQVEKLREERAEQKLKDSMRAQKEQEKENAAKSAMEDEKKQYAKRMAAGMAENEAKKTAEQDAKKQEKEQLAKKQEQHEKTFMELRIKTADELASKGASEAKIKKESETTAAARRETEMKQRVESTEKQAAESAAKHKSEQKEKKEKELEQQRYEELRDKGMKEGNAKRVAQQEAMAELEKQKQKAKEEADKYAAQQLQEAQQKAREAGLTESKAKAAGEAAVKKSTEEEKKRVQEEGEKASLALQKKQQAEERDKSAAEASKKKYEEERRKGVEEVDAKKIAEATGKKAQEQSWKTEKAEQEKAMLEQGRKTAAEHIVKETAENQQKGQKEGDAKRNAEQEVKKQQKADFDKQKEEWEKKMKKDEDEAKRFTAIEKAKVQAAMEQKEKSDKVAAARSAEEKEKTMKELMQKEQANRIAEERNKKDEATAKGQLQEEKNKQTLAAARMQQLRTADNAKRQVNGPQHWRGEYVENGKKEPMTMDFVIHSDARLTGAGVDRVGPYTLEGKVDFKPDVPTYKWNKLYKGSVAVQYDGLLTNDGQVLYGRYTAQAASDEFKLRLSPPRPEPQRQQQTVSVALNARNRLQPWASEDNKVTVTPTTLPVQYHGFTMEGCNFAGAVVNGNNLRTLAFDISPKKLPAVTVEIFFRVMSVPKTSGWLFATDDGTAFSRALMLNDARFGKSKMALGVGGTYASTISRPTVGDWTHAVAVWDQTTELDHARAMFYVDYAGRDSGQGQIQAMVARNRKGGASIFLGGLPGKPDTYADVEIAYINIYETALSEAEVVKRYRLRSPCGSKDPMFVEGNVPFKGYYTQKGHNEPMQLALSMKQGRIFGNGSDSVGKFTVQGTYAVQPVGPISWTKFYDKYVVSYNGTLSPDTFLIKGNWRIDSRDVATTEHRRVLNSTDRFEIRALDIGLDPPSPPVLVPANPVAPSDPVTTTPAPTTTTTRAPTTTPAPTTTTTTAAPRVAVKQTQAPATTAAPVIVVKTTPKPTTPAPTTQKPTLPPVAQPICKVKYSGYYMQTNKRHEMSLDVELFDSKVSGRGKDDVGDFTLSGSYDPTKMAVTKQYVGKHMVTYKGDFTDHTMREIAGTWYIDTVNKAKKTHDAFKLWAIGVSDDPRCAKHRPPPGFKLQLEPKKPPAAIAQCSYWGDPHLVSFSKAHVDLHQTGEFIMFEDKEAAETITNMQIVVNHVGYNIGFTFRAGDNVVTLRRLNPRRDRQMELRINCQKQNVDLLRDFEIRRGSFLVMRKGTNIRIENGDTYTVLDINEQASYSPHVGTYLFDMLLSVDNAVLPRVGGFCGNAQGCRDARYSSISCQLAGAAWRAPDTRTSDFICGPNDVVPSSFVDPAHDWSKNPAKSPLGQNDPEGLKRAQAVCGEKVKAEQVGSCIIEMLMSPLQTNTVLDGFAKRHLLKEQDKVLVQQMIAKQDVVSVVPPAPQATPTTTQLQQQQQQANKGQQQQSGKGQQQQQQQSHKGQQQQQKPPQQQQQKPQQQQQQPQQQKPQQQQQQKPQQQKPPQQQQQQPATKPPQQQQQQPQQQKPQQQQQQQQPQQQKPPQQQQQQQATKPPQQQQQQQPQQQRPAQQQQQKPK